MNAPVKDFAPTRRALMIGAAASAGGRGDQQRPSRRLSQHRHAATPATSLIAARMR